MSEVIPRLNAALQGRYRIDREIGEGGMAVVYLATDLRHERKVALKVLKPELAAVVGGERFLAEIKTTAQLQHPHILPLHDSGEADGFLFFVMPYVEGETLRERIAREKQLPVDEAVRIATAVANALHAAHEHGIVHRDIKPGNILLSQGEPLIADFGIALAVGAAAGGSRLTETGLSVGTPYYMSPEQATGDQIVGPPSDIYALACVLYEMLTGDPPYLGNTAQAVLGKIIQGVPVSATSVRKSIPANVDAAVRKALERLPADRFTEAQDFARALADPAFRHGEGAGSTPAASRRWRLVGYTGWAVAAALVGVLGWMTTRPTPPAHVERFAMPFLSGQELKFIGRGGFSLSPDGTMLVYRLVVDGQQVLAVRRWDDLSATPVRETTGGGMPAVSPDGKELAFVQSNQVKVLPLEGGPVRTLGPGFYPRWGPDGYVHVLSPDSGAVRYPSTGGPATKDTHWKKGDPLEAVWTVLPGGKGALLMVGPNTSHPEIDALDLETGEHRRIVAGKFPTYTPTGHLVYLVGGTLMAAPFDPKAMKLTRPSVAVLDGVGAYTLSEDGKLFYTTGGGSGNVLRQLVWVDRSGKVSPVDPSWTFDRGSDVNEGWSISPDGSEVAFRAFAENNYDIWIKHLPRGPLSRLTLDSAQDKMPFWSPDGRNVTFVSNRDGTYDVWTKPANGTGSPKKLVGMKEGIATAAWSPDGKWLILRTAGAGGVKGGRDIYGFRPVVDSVPRPLMTGTYDEVDPSVSPDGRWIVYTSNETGRYEVYVRPFPAVDSGRWQISVDGGLGARWSRDGREIFFADANGNFDHVRVNATKGFSAGPPEVLFKIPEEIATTDITFIYDVAPDGRRFLMASTRPAAASGKKAEKETAPAAILVDNFSEELRRLVPK